MDTKDTAEKRAPSVAPAKRAPKPRPGEPEPEEPAPSVPLSWLGDDSLEGSGAFFNGLSVGGPEGKEKEKEKEAVDMGVEDKDAGDKQEESDEVLFNDKLAESTPSASVHPAVTCATTTTLPATHPATSSPATTQPMAEGLDFTGMPHPTYGVTLASSASPMATAFSEKVASSSTYTGIHEPAPLRYAEGCHRPPAGLARTYITGYAAPETGYTIPAPGFASLSGLRGPESCGGREGDQEDPLTGLRHARRLRKLFAALLQRYSSM